jgi:hypothetical protein
MPTTTQTRHLPHPVSTLWKTVSLGSSLESPKVPWYQLGSNLESYITASLCFDSRRRRPLIIASQNSRYGTLINPGRLAERVGDVADVIQITSSSAANLLQKILGPSLGVWGGACRIINPDAHPDDEKECHPLVTIRPEELDYELRAEHRLDSLLDKKPPSRRIEGPDNSAELAEARATASEAKKTANALRKEIASLKDALAERTRPVYSDPLVQFNYELHNAWLQSVSEPEREQTWPLRSWNVGPDFLDSIEEQQVVDRSQVVKACVDVATGRHAELASRASHKMRPSSAAPTPTRDDGGKLWRCYVAHNTPSAPRLHWWQLPDGAVEFAYVGLHDDYRTG